MTIQVDSLFLAMLRTLRGTLHSCAEVSGQEQMTANVITNFLEAYRPHSILTELGGHGVAAVFQGESAGPTVLLRAELDGLPTDPSTAAHLCGHDGHMTMLAGLAPLLQQTPPARGRVVLLFQPAEETGEGAARVIADRQFDAIRPDYAIALHNLPGLPLGTIAYRRDTFASASVGIRVELQGISGHAAQPQLATTPTGAVRKILSKLEENVYKANPQQFVTVTHLLMGREDYGIAPGVALMCATLRSASEKLLNELCHDVEHFIRATAATNGLSATVSWVERFPETANDIELVDLLESSCLALGLNTKLLPEPFSWSEDFGHYSSVCPTLYFGLGIGEHAPGLHLPDYTFPDEVFRFGIGVFHQLLRTLTGSPIANQLTVESSPLLPKRANDN